MKIAMKLTLTDLIRTLRWQAMEVAEQAVERTNKAPVPTAQKDDKP
ncbi:hypothetical protein [Phyllobacterium sp. YR531]|nr:hypothetical protein [Phyllobacterium sp. YR531]EJN01413.1 hypothetical protein PMI41_03495 [Phyllobacterium sp. YR531]